MADDPETSPLIPRVERTVDFYGDPIPIAVIDDEAYVPLRMITEYLGLNWSGQRQRTLRDPVLARHVQEIVMMAADGKRYEMLSLSLEYLPGWLFGITTSRVRDEIASKLERYREECFRILWRAFQADVSPQAPASSTSAPLEQVRGLALAIATLAEQQMATEGRVEVVDAKASTALARIDRAAEIVSALQRRLSLTEKTVTALDSQGADHDEAITEIRQLVTQLQEKAQMLPAPGERIGPAEKASLKALVDDIVAEADVKGLKLGQGRNNFQSVWSQFNRRFDLAKYEELTVAQYDQALTWLKAWRDRIVGTQAES